MKKIKNTLALVAITLFLTAFTTNVATQYDPSGVWTYEVESPDGTLTGDMTISKSEGNYEVSIETQAYGTIELEEVSLDKTTLEGSAEVNGGPVDFEFEFDGDSMEGSVYVGESEMPITAERKK